MTEFNQFKESIINTLTEMDNEFFLEEGGYLYEEEITALRAVNTFSHLAQILVECEYWDFSDAIYYGRVVKEYTLVNN